jgi:hypothetical protein
MKAMSKIDDRCKSFTTAIFVTSFKRETRLKYCDEMRGCLVLDEMILHKILLSNHQQTERLEPAVASTKERMGRVLIAFKRPSGGEEGKLVDGMAC